MLLGDTIPALYTLSADGALFEYAFAFDVTSKRPREEPDAPFPSISFAAGSWSLLGKHYFSQDNCKLTAADYHGSMGLLVTAFSSGTFLLHQLPAFEHIQSLSMTRERISSVRFNASGDWIALGCASFGQLLVWEWRSETYVLKQQGHFFDVSALAFSPDGAHLASGSDDARVKVWSVASGYSFVTFSEHRGAITGITFTPSSNAVLSSSLDGTVRAFDLVRCAAALSGVNASLPLAFVHRVGGLYQGWCIRLRAYDSASSMTPSTICFASFVL